MCRNVVNSDRFWPSKGHILVVLVDIDFKFATHIYRASLYRIYSDFWKMLQNSENMGKQIFEFEW